ncbi:MAG TPA: VacJ family lipoprotein [Burkholderiaceae bacterium]|nr:VacJ family lipoprotein [Burkholderiaceae bacterium]
MTGVVLAHPEYVETSMRSLRRAIGATVIALLALMTGCATVPPNAGQDPRDPLESFNRQVFEFNEGLDKVVLKPLAQVYDKVLPVPVQDCLSNGFSNLREPSNALNNLLQGKGGDAVSDVCRFTVNTTVGLLGCFDVASRMGLEKHREDFGQTLGVWGVGNGSYLVLPLFGPSTFRDTVGLGVETVLDVNFWLDNVSVRNTIFGVRTVNYRHELLKTDDLISGAALDKYTFVRDGYLQRRRNLVYDGNPPRDKAPDDEEEDKKADEGKGRPGPPAAGSDVKPSSPPKPAQ